MNQRLLCYVICILLLYLSGCLSEAFIPKSKRLPKEGIWYCETLQMQLGFGESAESKSESWVVLNGEKILCVWANDRGSPVIRIFSAETTTIQADHPLLLLELISVSENAIVVTDRDTNVTHTFVNVGQ